MPRSEENASATEVERELTPLGERPGFSVCVAAAPAAKDVSDVVHFKTLRGKMLTFVFPIRRSQRRRDVGRDHEIGRAPGEAHPIVHPSKIKVRKCTWWRNQVEDGIEIRCRNDSFPNSALAQNELDREILLAQFRGDR